MWTNRHVPNIIPYYNNLNADGTPAAGEVLRSVQLTNSNGRVQLKGIEAEAALLVTTGLTLESTFSISDTKIKRTGCTDCTALIGNANPVGNQLPSYPKYAGTASATYEHEVGDGIMGFIRGDMIYTGKQYDTEANLSYTGAAAVVNARIGAEFQKYKIEFFIRNLLNNDTATSLARGSQSIYNTNGTIARTANGITVSLPEPATYGMKVSAKF
jgi:iron complex outermembrane receptor protein